MKELVVATDNKGKLREIAGALDVLKFRVVSYREYPPVPTIEEDGATFRDNALKKARIVARHTRRLTIADDSGLEVDALQGRPGVHSARFAGATATDQENNRKLLDSLDAVPPEERGAAFRCVIAVVDPDGREAVVEGACRGVIEVNERGSGGFGYDPLFVIPELGKTLAELPLSLKNRVSHRGKALDALKEVLGDFL